MLRNPSVRVVALTVLLLFSAMSSVTLQKPEANEFLDEELLIVDEGQVSRIECMGEKLEDARSETTLTVPASFLKPSKTFNLFQKVNAHSGKFIIVLTSIAKSRSHFTAS